MPADFVMESEVTQKVGAEPHEHSDERTGIATYTATAEQTLRGAARRCSISWPSRVPWFSAVRACSANR